MKLILRNTNLVFEKTIEQHYLQSYDAFGGDDCAISGNGSIVGADATTEHKRMQLYNVSDFAGQNLNVEVFYNLSPNSTNNVILFSFSTNLVTHDDAEGEHKVIEMNNGLLTSEGLTKEWNIPDKPASCCKITGTILIPEGSKAMAVCSGKYLTTGVDYPDNSKVYYFE